MSFWDAMGFALFSAIMEEQEDNELLDNEEELADEEENGWLDDDLEEDQFDRLVSLSKKTREDSEAAIEVPEEDQFDRMKEAELDFASFCSQFGFSDIHYIPDYTTIDLGKEFVDQEIEKMEEYKDKLHWYLSLEGNPELISYVEDIDDYIDKIDYLYSAGLLDKQDEYMELDYDTIVSLTKKPEEDSEDKVEELNENFDLEAEVNDDDDFWEDME